MPLPSRLLPALVLLLGESSGSAPEAELGGTQRSPWVLGIAPLGTGRALCSPRPSLRPGPTVRGPGRRPVLLDTWNLRASGSPLTQPLGGTLPTTWGALGPVQPASQASCAWLGLGREPPATDPAPPSDLLDHPRHPGWGHPATPLPVSAGSRVPRRGLGPQPLPGPPGHRVQLCVRLRGLL